MNTLGALLGALLGGWVLVGWLGFVGALVFAAALNLIAALVALSLLRGLPAHAEAAATFTVDAEAADAIGGTHHRAARAADERAAATEPYGGLIKWCGLVFLSGYVIVARWPGGRYRSGRWSRSWHPTRSGSMHRVSSRCSCSHRWSWRLRRS